MWRDTPAQFAHFAQFGTLNLANLANLAGLAQRFEPSPEAKPSGTSILFDLDPDAEGVPWAVWYAEQSNSRWMEEGVTKQPGRLKPGTVTDGLLKYCRKRGDL